MFLLRFTVTFAKRLPKTTCKEKVFLFDDKFHFIDLKFLYPVEFFCQDLFGENCSKIVRDNSVSKNEVIYSYSAHVCCHAQATVLSLIHLKNVMKLLISFIN
jgi:hypothetical protein